LVIVLVEMGVEKKYETKGFEDSSSLEIVSLKEEVVDPTY
jgi:hypothetical protein